MERFRKKYHESINILLKYVGLSESSYYYKDKPDGRKGILPSRETKRSTAGMVDEATVVEAIKGVLEHEFIDCGYRIIT